MGSKKLKAIVVHGTQAVPVADPTGLKAVNRKIVASMKESLGAAGFKEGGTGIGASENALIGDSPVKNWRGSPTSVRRRLSCIARSR